MASLIKKTFTTKDTKGCEFRCTALYEGSATNRTARYYGVGQVADSLEELKKKISELP